MYYKLYGVISKESGVNEEIGAISSSYNKAYEKLQALVNPSMYNAYYIIQSERKGAYPLGYYIADRGGKVYSSGIMAETFLPKFWESESNFKSVDPFKSLSYTERLENKIKRLESHIKTIRKFNT